MEFIRYGNLTIQSHKRYGEDSDFYHTPPVKYGIYAFPKGYVETYLLTGIGKGSLQNGRYKYLRDKNGKKVFANNSEFIKLEKKYKKLNLIWVEPDFIDVYPEAEHLPDNEVEVLYNKYINEYLESNRFPVYVENKPIHFNYNGLIWHHLYIDEGKDKLKPYYIKRIGTWVLTDINTYNKCLKRETIRNRVNFHNDYLRLKREGHDIWIKPYLATTCPLRYSKDHYEVYIEKL